MTEEAATTPWRVCELPLRLITWFLSDLWAAEQARLWEGAVVPRNRPSSGQAFCRSADPARALE